MKIEGKRRYVKRAVFAACLLDVYDFSLTILEDAEVTDIVRNSEKEFTMRIERGFHKAILAEIIGHEMVHLKQYLCGDMTDVENDQVIWKGEYFDEPESHLSDEYFLAPWEMEARALEGWIGHRYNNNRSKNELH